MNLKKLTVFCICMTMVAFVVNAEVIEKTFFHQLKIGDEPQNFRHVIPLPEAEMMSGRVFSERDLSLMMGDLAIVREELTPMYYFIEVRLTKHKKLPAAGQVTVELKTGKGISSQVSKPPQNLSIAEISAALKPIFTWEAEDRYAVVSLYDLTKDELIWERISPTSGFIAYDEGFLDNGHEYEWSVRVGKSNGNFSEPKLARFEIRTIDGVVTIIEK